MTLRDYFMSGNLKFHGTKVIYKHCSNIQTEKGTWKGKVSKTEGADTRSAVIHTPPSTRVLIHGTPHQSLRTNSGYSHISPRVLIHSTLPSAPEYWYTVLPIGPRVLVHGTPPSVPEYWYTVLPIHLQTLLQEILTCDLDTQYVQLQTAFPQFKMGIVFQSPYEIFFAILKKRQVWFTVQELTGKIYPSSNI